MRIVTRHARHRVGAAARQEIARLAGADVAPARISAPLTPFPGERVAGEQNLVAARTGAVDGLCPRIAFGLLFPRGSLREEERTSNLERRLLLEVEGVLSTLRHDTTRNQSRPRPDATHRSSSWWPATLLRGHATHFCGRGHLASGSRNCISGMRGGYDRARIGDRQARRRPSGSRRSTTSPW